MQIDKAKNGYILKHMGDVYVYDNFPQLMRALCVAFEEREYLPNNDPAKKVPKIKSPRVAVTGKVGK